MDRVEPGLGDAESVVLVVEVDGPVSSVSDGEGEPSRDAGADVDADPVDDGRVELVDVVPDEAGVEVTEVGGGAG